MPPCPGHIATSKLKSRMSILVPLCIQHCTRLAHPTWVCSGGRCVEAGPQVDTWEGPTMLPGLAGAKKVHFLACFCQKVSRRCQFCWENYLKLGCWHRDNSFILTWRHIDTKALIFTKMMSFRSINSRSGFLQEDADHLAALVYRKTYKSIDYFCKIPEKTGHTWKNLKDQRSVCCSKNDHNYQNL